MSTTLFFAGNQITIYFGTPIFIVGTVGNILNTLVFLSLRTFRQSSCAFYLMIMSIFDVLTLCSALLQVILPVLSDFAGSVTSLFYCKFGLYFEVVSIQTSLTCLCLATIDQYCATCSRPRLQQLCNIKLAQRLIIISIMVWVLHGIPFLVFYNQVVSTTTNQVTCIDTNNIYEQYRIFVIILVLIGYLPIVIVALFGWLAYHNVQQIAYRIVPLVRRQLDKQLTVMVLVQVVVNILTLLPFTTVFAVAKSKNLTVDPVLQAKFLFAITVTLIVSYTAFASPFYIFICTSARFRRQLIHVLFTVHLNRWKRPRPVINQVTPEI